MNGSELANFSASLLEYVIGRAETIKLKAIRTPNITIIEIGDRQFKAVTLEEAFDTVFTFLLTRKVQFTPAQLQAMGREYDLVQEAESIREVEALTESGMNRLGITVEALKEERRLLIIQAAANLPLNGSFDSILTELRKVPDLSDIELPELWQVLSTHVFPAPQSDVGANEALSGSNTKAN